MSRPGQALASFKGSSDTPITLRAGPPTTGRGRDYQQHGEALGHFPSMHFRLLRADITAYPGRRRSVFAFCEPAEGRLSLAAHDWMFPYGNMCRATSVSPSTHGRMRIPGHRALTSLICPSTTCANTKAPDHQDAHWRKCALSAPKARGVLLTTLLRQGSLERGYSSRTSGSTV